MEERTYGRAVGRSVGRSDGSEVITKPSFLALMGLPKSLSYVISFPEAAFLLVSTKEARPLG